MSHDPPSKRNWTVIGSTHPIKNRWLTVRADECRTDDGLPVGKYYVLEYPPWTHMVVIDSEDRILVTRQYRHPIGEEIYEIPCGCAWPGDKENPLDAARRELREETGYEGEFKEVARMRPNPATHDNWVHTYLVTRPIRKSEPVDVLEEVECKFIDLLQLRDLVDQGRFPQAMHFCGVVLALRSEPRLLRKFLGL